MSLVLHLILAAICDCGTPWIFLLPFYGVYISQLIVLVEHLVKLMTLIIKIKFKFLNYLTKDTVIVIYVKYFLSFIAVILNYYQNIRLT